MAPRKDPEETLTVLLRSGLTYVKELLRKTGINEKTLHRNLAKLKKGKTLKRKWETQKKIRSSNRASLTQIARAHPEYSAKDLRNELQERRDVNVCTRTVQRSLSDSGYTKKKANKILDLTIVQNVGC